MKLSASQPDIPPQAKPFSRVPRITALGKRSAAHTVLQSRVSLRRTEWSRPASAQSASTSPVVASFRILYTNPRFAVAKLPIFGKIVGICAALTPDHEASVAADCTLPVER